MGVPAIVYLKTQPRPGEALKETAAYLHASNLPPGVPSVETLGLLDPILHISISFACESARRRKERRVRRTFPVRESRRALFCELL